MNKERLLKIANHLKSGELGHKEFNFSVINGFRTVERDSAYGPTDIDELSFWACEGIPDEAYAKKEINCGTLGCAIGEFPIIFSEDWSFNQIGMLTHIGGRGDIWVTTGNYLNLSPTEVEHLFIPNEQCLYKAEMLGDDATKEQVADNILHFIEMKEKEEAEEREEGDEYH